MENKKLFIYFLMGVCLLSIIMGIALILKPSPKTITRESKVELSLGKEGVAVVYLYGAIRVPMQETLMPAFSTGADQIVERLKKIRKNPKAKAVVLRINSPGGTVAACQEIFEEINKLKQEGKKIVVSMGDVAASGGYYVACAADKIMANPGTITGSIGVIASMGNVDELFKKIGIKTEVIKSGKYKDIGSPTRPMTPEERDLLQKLINNAYDQFLKAISQGRNITYEKAKQWGDGGILTGEQAQALGMIDQLGNFQDAIKLAGELAGIKGEPYLIKDYTPFEKFFEMFDRRLENYTSLNKIFDKTGLRLEYILE